MRPWNQFRHRKTAPQRGAKHVSRTGKIMALVAVSTSKRPAAVIRRSQYLTVLSRVVANSRKTTLRLEDAHYLMRLITAMAPISATKTPIKSPLDSAFGSYPALLIREYDALTDKKLRRTITPSERTRLQEVRDEIAAIDEQRLRPDTWDVQAQKLRQELAQLRAEVDALPDATSTPR